MFKKLLSASRKPSPETEKVIAQKAPVQKPSSEVLKEGEMVYPRGRPLMPPGRLQEIMDSLTTEVVGNLREATKDNKSLKVASSL